MVELNVVAGRYRLTDKIGQGGMGEVWAARDLVLSRMVALKRLNLPESLDGTHRVQYERRLVREARAAAAIDHPSVISVYDVIEDSGGPCIVMKLIDGDSLHGIVKEKGPLTERQAARIGLRLLEALNCAHEQDILHRDVKPANVLITARGEAIEDEQVILTDFGIAAVRDGTVYTRTGMFLGTPGYMSPEQLENPSAVGPESDLWALGATLFFALEGRPHFHGGTAANLGDLAQLIRGLLEPDPGHRPGAREAIQELKALLAAERAPALPTNPIEPEPPTRKDRKQKFIDATESARQLATILGIDLSTLKGTGQNRRITYQDIRKRIEQRPDGTVRVRTGPGIRIYTRDGLQKLVAQGYTQLQFLVTEARPGEEASLDAEINAEWTAGPETTINEGWTAEPETKFSWSDALGILCIPASVGVAVLALSGLSASSPFGGYDFGDKVFLSLFLGGLPSLFFFYGLVTLTSLIAERVEGVTEDGAGRAAWIFSGAFFVVVIAVLLAVTS